MQPFEQIESYIAAVCGHIRWKKVRPVIAEELENHIHDQKAAFIAQGMDEAEATKNAIREMGDSETVGTQLDRAYRPKPQWGMLALTLALVAAGYVIQLFVFGTGLTGNSVFAALIGAALLFAAYFADFTLIGRFPKTVYCVILLASVAAVLLSPTVNGSRMNAVPYMLILPVSFAAVVYAMRGKGYGGIALCGLAYLLPMCISCVTSVYLIPAAVSLLFTVCALVILSVAVSRRYFAVKPLYGQLMVWLPLLILLAFVCFSVFQRDYRFDRYQAILDPSHDPNGRGFIGMSIQTMIDGSVFIGHGAVTGAEPLWQGNAGDYMLTYLIYHTGWLSFFAVMGLVAAFIALGFRLCLKQKNALALLVSLAVMLTFILQAAGYVAVNLGFPLLSPISLPLVSYGNTALIINLALAGLMLSVFRTGAAASETCMSTAISRRFITCGDGKLIIDFKKKQ